MINLSYLKRRFSEFHELNRIKTIVSNEIKLETPLNFLISPGRSGSTLLRKHLVERTNVHIPPESASFLIDVARAYNPNISWEKRVEMALLKFNSLSLNEYWQFKLSDLENHLLKIDPNSRSLVGLLIGFYKFHGQTNKPSAKIFTDKTPFLSQNLKWLQAIFPQSKYLFLFRDPYEVVFSRKINFNEDLIEAANKWLWAEKEYSRVQYSLNSKLIFYENLIKNFDQVIMEITNFFNAYLLKNIEEVNLGEEHLNHHQRLGDPIKKIKKSSFSDQEIRLLRSYFLKAKSKSIRKYYSIE